MSETKLATEWRISQRTYPAIRGTNQLAVTPEELDEALEAYAALCNRDMAAALKDSLDVMNGWLKFPPPGAEPSMFLKQTIAKTEAAIAKAGTQ